MNNINSWEAQTKELIKRVEQEIEEIRTNAELRIGFLQDRKAYLQKALEAYSEMMGTQTVETQSLSRSDVDNKSHHEILKFIALRNNGLLVARTAIRLMKQANVFGNPLNADAAVYSILGRSKEFVKVGKGVYKLNGHKDTKALKLKGGISELKLTMKELKEKNPQMTKLNMRNALIQQGFDFQGKRPGRAVHMAWVNLGYAKKATQPPLISQPSLPGVS